MNLKKIFHSLAFAFGMVFVLGITPCLHVSAVEEYVIPGQDAFREVSGTQEENVVVGDEKTEVSVSSSKVSIDYSGKIDDSTGEAAVGNAIDMSTGYYVLKKNELAYHVKRNQYHILCGDRGVYCNVPEGAVLSNGESLQFIPDEGITCEIYFEGELMENDILTEFRESGEYLITMHNHAEAKERSARFVILGDPVSNLREYRLPEGFEYTGVYLDGVKKSLSYNNYYDFLEEGNYKLQWENSKIGQVFITEFTLDLTAPTLKLPEVYNGVATAQVSFADMEAGEYVRWIKDSRKEGRIEDPSEVLSEIGNYIIRVYDQAGNYTEYTFEIEGYFDANAVLAIILAITLLGSGFFYCRRLRKHMRVG
jgi:hypothetical protein